MAAKAGNEGGRPGAVRAVPPSRAALAFALAASLLAIPQALLLGDAVATVAIGPGAGLTGLVGWPLWLLLAAVGVARIGLDAAATRLAGLAAVAAKGVLRGAWLSGFARWSPVAPRRAATGDVVATLVDRVDGLDPWFVRYPIARLRMAVVPPAILLAVLPVSWAAALLLLLAGPFIPVFMALIGARAEAVARRRLDEAGDLDALLLDRVGGLATLRAVGAGDRVAAEIAGRGEALRGRTMEVLAVAFLSSAALEFFASVGIALAAVFIGFHLLGFVSFGGDFGLAGGVAMLALAPEYFQPLRDFAAAYHDRADALALDARGEDVFRVAIPRMAASTRRRRAAGPSDAPAVAVRDLRVAAAGRQGWVLDGVSFDLAAGGLLAVTGPSGAGKTTLLACFGGLLADVEGTVFVGGRPPGDAAGPPACWLGQEPLIRQGSVLANLAPAGAPPSRDEAWRVLGAVGLADVVRRMPRGLLTPLGETGAGLSRGELRRIAVARTLLDPAPLVLADEPTADLDAVSAAIVRRAVVAMAGRRTVVVATHDDALAALAPARLDLAAVPA